MAISKIKTGSITDSAVNTDKLAPGSVGSTDLSATVITGQTELSETAADTDYTIIYDSSAGALKKILRSNLKQAGPTISSISPTNTTDSVATETFTITGTGFTAGSNARLIDNNGKILEFDTVTRDSTTQITATIATNKFGVLNDPYDVQVTNGEGIASLLANQINFNALPTFVTAAGSLGTFNDDQRTGISLSVNATDPDSAGDVTFEIQSGSLPAGLSLTNTSAEGGTAIISGTADAVGADTTSNFVLRAVDAASNTTSRSFSITINAPVVQTFTSSGTFTVPSGITSVDVLVVASGGFGAGSGAGGLVYRPGFPVTPGGTIPVTIGGNPGNSPGQPGAPYTGFPYWDPADDTTFGTLTAKGGGSSGFGGGANGRPGGSGAGGSGTGCGGQPGGTGGTAIQPTFAPGQESSNYGHGNPGGNGNNSDRGGGGGGAGGAGGNACGTTPGAAGAGNSYTIADGSTPVIYSRGGVSSATAPTCGYGANRGSGAAPFYAGDSATYPACSSPAPHNPAPNSGGKGVVIVRWG